MTTDILTTRLNSRGGNRLVLARVTRSYSTKGYFTPVRNAVAYANRTQAERKRDELLPVLSRPVRPHDVRMRRARHEATMLTRPVHPSLVRP